MLGEHNLRFNARVLDERLSPACRKPRPDAIGNGSVPFPETPVEMAFSMEAAGLLETSSIAFTSGAGGVRTRISRDLLEHRRRVFKISDIVTVVAGPWFAGFLIDGFT